MFLGLTQLSWASFFILLWLLLTELQPATPARIVTLSILLVLGIFSLAGYYGMDAEFQEWQKEKQDATPERDTN